MVCGWLVARARQGCAGLQPIAANAGSDVRAVRALVALNLKLAFNDGQQRLQRLVKIGRGGREVRVGDVPRVRDVYRPRPLTLVAFKHRPTAILPVTSPN